MCNFKSVNVTCACKLERADTAASIARVECPGSEMARARDHQPKSGDRYICWSFSTWAGCKKTNCDRVHQPMGKWGLLDYSLQLLCLSRGGHKQHHPSKLTAADIKAQMHSIREAQLLQ